MSVLLFSVRWTTKNDVREETIANMELMDPCYLRTCKCRTPVTGELESPRPLSPLNLEVLDPVTRELGMFFFFFFKKKKKKNITCQRPEVATADFSDSEWLDSGFQWLGVACGKRNVFFFFENTTVASGATKTTNPHEHNTMPKTSHTP